MREFNTNYRSLREDESLVDYYKEHNESRLSDSTLGEVQSSWNHLQEFIEISDDLQTSYDMSEEKVYDFIEFLRGKDEIEKESTVEGNVRRVGTMVTWFNEKGIVSGNPFQKAIESKPFKDTTPPAKVHVPLEELKHGIASIANPQKLLIVVTLLKTGLRIAELANLDERDIYLDHCIENRLDKRRPELTGKPNAIYIDSSICGGDVVNGEERSYPNKPDSTRIVPLDSELVDVLVWYLSMRPAPMSEANPMLTNGEGQYVGRRLGNQGIRDRFNEWSKEMGWYSPDSRGVKPHWCRHWFTTTVRSRLNESLVEVGTGDDYIDYLRGDTSTDTKSDYIQMDWGAENWMHHALENALPKLL